MSTRSSRAARIFWTVVLLTGAPTLCHGAWGGSLFRSGDRSAPHVTADVDGAITVEPIQAVEVAALASMGEVEVSTEFRVSSNKDRLWFQCFASDLFRSGDPTSEARIPHEGGVLLSISGASPLGGEPPYLRFKGEEGTIDVQGFRLYPTVAREWQSSSDGSFDRTVVATFSWRQAWATVPRGEYSGFVKLVAYRLMP